MLSSIHPLGERARGSRWWITATAYIAGSVAGGATLGVTAGTLGWVLLRGVPTNALLVVFLIVAVLAVLREWGLVPMPLPSIHRQVDEDWLNEYRGWVYGIAFGYQLGLGVVTIITTATLHLMIIVIAFGTSPAAGVLVGAIFGLVRGGFVLLVRRIQTPAALIDFHKALARRAYQGELLARWSLLGALAVAGAGVGVVLS